MDRYPTTHAATCTDDGLTIPLHHRASVACDTCEREGSFLILGDGGPGWICAECAADLDWVIVSA